LYIKSFPPDSWADPDSNSEDEIISLCNIYDHETNCGSLIKVEHEYAEYHEENYILRGGDYCSKYKNGSDGSELPEGKYWICPDDIENRYLHSGCEEAGVSYVEVCPQFQVYPTKNDITKNDIQQDNASCQSVSTDTLQLSSVGVHLRQNIYSQFRNAAVHTPGDSSTISRVRRLQYHSKQTPNDKRTPARVCLHQPYPTFQQHSPWTIISPPLLPTPSSSSRPWSDSCLPSLSHPNISSAQPFSSEIFVDASGSGIGFWFDERWLAWKFKYPCSNDNIPTDKNGKVITSWAELIAVELGVLALISAQFSNTSIIVFSDNCGVVDALSRGKWKSAFGLQDVLDRILAMCCNSNLELQVKWVASKDNPADGPSRGVFLSREMMFTTRSVVPAYLSSVLQEV
jgi:hypothetical protein